MRRTQIYLDDDLHQSLREVAGAEGRSAAAIIRDAVRAYLAQIYHDAGDDPIRRMIGAFEGLPNDASAEIDRDLYRS